VSTLNIRFRSRHQYGPNLFADSYAIDRAIAVSTTTNPLLTEMGIACDGEDLWFCTTGVIGRPARLIQVNPVSGTQDKNIAITGLLGQESCNDIVHDGWGFYAVTETVGDPNVWRIRYISEQGVVQKQPGWVLTGNAATENWRAVAFERSTDGHFLYITRYDATFVFTGFTFIEKWNVVKGIKEGIDLVITGSAMTSNDGWGIVHPGFQFICHSDPLFGVHGFWEYVPQDAIPGGIASARTVLKGPRAAGHRAPITFNRFHVIEFDVEVPGGD
jgi:hypothetical protein